MRFQTTPPSVTPNIRTLKSDTLRVILSFSMFKLPIFKHQ